MNTYVVELENEIYRKVESELEPQALLDKMRQEYIDDFNVFRTFTPHRNRIPVAVYRLEVKDHNNEPSSDK